MKFFGYYFDAFKKYLDFDGRATRREYWSFTVIHLAVFFLAVVIDRTTGKLLFGTAFGYAAVLYALLSIVPFLAIASRRLHDMDVDGKWSAVLLLPYVRYILLVLLAFPGKKGQNNFGSDPRQQTLSDNDDTSDKPQSHLASKLKSVPRPEFNRDFALGLLALWVGSICTYFTWQHYSYEGQFSGFSGLIFLAVVVPIAVASFYLACKKIPRPVLWTIVFMALAGIVLIIGKNALETYQKNQDIREERAAQQLREEEQKKVANARQSTVKSLQQLYRIDCNNIAIPNPPPTVDPEYLKKLAAERCEENLIRKANRDRIIDYSFVEYPFSYY